ncbi:hypothetical protein [Deinococcus sp. Marseille-Q6407]|uniref:hypothetical protein n=1 Tax=Deinococcus sp. Marseille-Q6407 TaxID=2969223 RepID=UPI0021C0FEBA|nr:hypothetical protein [Deinococcus sp. Marseille-Q6407]
MRHFLTGTLLSLLPLIAAHALAAPTSKTAGTAWGQWTVQTQPRPEESRLNLLRRDRTDLTLQEHLIQTEQQPLRPGGLPELAVSLYSGGAHCCTTLVILTQDPGFLKTLGVLDLGNGAVEYRDLNGDGTREMLVWGDSLAYYDWSYAASPGLRTVVGWDSAQGRLTDQTGRYPGIPLSQARAYRNELIQLLHTGKTAETQESQHAMLAGWYTNMVLGGQSTQAERQVRQLTAAYPELQNWFRKHRGDLLAAAKSERSGRLLTGPAALKQLNRAQDTQ